MALRYGGRFRAPRDPKAFKAPRVDYADSLARQIEYDGTLPKPERNFRFHPSRKWQMDLAWPDRRLFAEVEGGTFGQKEITMDGREVRVGGRHSRGKSFERDCEKYNAAALAGWRLLRFTTDMVRDGRAIGIVALALQPTGDLAT